MISSAWEKLTKINISSIYRKKRSLQINFSMLSFEFARITAKRFYAQSIPAALYQPKWHTNSTGSAALLRAVSSSLVKKAEQKWQMAEHMRLSLESEKTISKRQLGFRSCQLTEAELFWLLINWFRLPVRKSIERESSSPYLRLPTVAILMGSC